MESPVFWIFLHQIVLGGNDSIVYLFQETSNGKHYDIMRVLPEDPRCTSFADYILEITLCRIQGFLHIVVFITVTQRKAHN
jgi:hypothetical protein